jgi:hypothetical protein
MTFNASGLTFKCFDTITSHDFCDDTDWPIDENENKTSIWKVQPYSGELFEIIDVRVFMSSDVVMNTNLIIELWSDLDSEDPLRVITYNGRRSFICRADRIEKVDHSCAVGNNVTHDVHIYIINFAQKVVLWSSTGTYQGDTKANYMTIRLESNSPLKNENNSPGQLARCRYYLSRYLEG